MMDVKEAQSLAGRIDEADEPEVRFIVNAVSFLVHQRTESGTFTIVAMGQVDRHGHVTLSPPRPHMPGSLAEHDQRQQDRREEYLEALLDNGLAEYRAVGAGDSELYATPAFMARLRASLRALPDGWQVWTP